MSPRKIKENPVDKMWNNFKGKLKSETIKWANSRSHGHNDKIRVNLQFLLHICDSVVNVTIRN